MASYIGRYEVQPGTAITVSASGQNLAVDAGDGLRYMLAQETDNIFTVGDTGIVAIFSRDPRGEVSGVTFNESGQQWAARRVD